ncbi:LysE family transporter, partial [Klebsiella michiganensis]
MAIIGLIASSSLGIVLVASPHALRVVKVIGAAYLLYLGTKVFRSKPRPLGLGFLKKHNMTLDMKNKIMYIVD